MKRIRLSTLMLLIVIVALGIALVVQQGRAARREAGLRARLAQSWPLFLMQQREDSKMRQLVEAMQHQHRKELAKRSEAEARRQQSEDAEINRQIEGMQRTYREEQVQRELGKRSEAEAQLQPK